MAQNIDVQSMTKLTHISAHTLRYYERIGLIANVPRTASGHRRYRETDVEWISFLQCLRQSGMTIQQMLAFAALDPTRKPPSAAVRNYLEQYRQEVLDRIRRQQAALALIDDKIERYKILLSTEKRNTP